MKRAWGIRDDGECRHRKVPVPLWLTEDQLAALDEMVWVEYEHCPQIVSQGVVKPASRAVFIFELLTAFFTEMSARLPQRHYGRSWLVTALARSGEHELVREARERRLAALEKGGA
ncbi:MAG: hypothetical protein LBK99_14285 [Opitutaceae bacterium]|nr:hypothetical protein [Opitutaceae bacterium]